MSSHECDEDINLVANAGNQANNTNSLHGVKECLKQTHEEDSEECNLIDSDNSGSECISTSKEMTEIDKSVRNVKRSSFNNSESYSTSFKIKRQSSEATAILSDIGGSKDLSPNQKFTHSNDKEMSSLGGNEMAPDLQPLTALQNPSTSNNSTNNKIENFHCYGSPLSDITDPEIVRVNSQGWVSRDSSKAEKIWHDSESPSSDVECSSSCAEDSGISSTVRDDEMEEIPLADGTLSPELFHEMSKLNVTDMVSSWVPKSNNTYSPSVSKDPQTSHVERKLGNDQSTVGWKLFGRVPPKEANKMESFKRGDIVRRSFERTLSRKARLPSLKKNNSSVTSSTTALIFENRPRNLPAKSPTEEKKHRQQYEAMVAQARKKELQEVKKHERQLKQKDEQEKQIVSAASVWLNEILPNWETMKGSRKAKELWWQGIPPSVRGRVWKLAIGNDLQITYELFDIFQAHAFEKLIVTRNNKKRLKQSKSVAELPTNNFIPVVSSEHKVELIMLDVSRTFPSLCIFQEGGPFHDLLHSILGAYTCYRPDVGYVQGMSFIAAVLLLNMDPPDAFVCFASLLNKPCQLVFFRVDHPMMKAYFATFEILLEEFLPKIASLFVEENFSPDMYLIDWIFTLFSKSLPLDVACRVWDVFCRDGDDFLFRTALGILKYYQHDLAGMDFIHLGQFLSKLPDDVSPSKLFDNIGAINLTRQKFNQILTQQKELATQIKSVTASAGK